MILFFYKNHLADATHSSHWFDRSQVLMSLSRQKHNAQNSVMLQTQFREEFTSLPVHHQKVTSCFFISVVQTHANGKVEKKDAIVTQQWCEGTTTHLQLTCETGEHKFVQGIKRHTHII